MKIQWIFTSFAIVAVGCQIYHPQPINTNTIQHALTPPPTSVLRVQARDLKHPILGPVTLDFDQGLSPDAAAVLAVLLNPGLRAVRDERGLANAQLLQAGLLPNPQLSYSLDQPSFGATAGTFTGYGIGLSWDTQELITHAARTKAARGHKEAVDLDVAWQEWQAAEAAKTAVYQLVALNEQLISSTAMDTRLAQNLAVIRRAVEASQMTALDLSTAETASTQAHANRLTLQKQAAQQRLELNRLIGLSPDTRIKLLATIELPSEIKLPTAIGLLRDLEKRRLDLVALQRGYASQEATVREAILAQFPKLNLGVNRQQDTSKVGTYGFGVTLDLPIFDRNQGVIAQERATRQKLFDEYASRVFDARAEVAKLLDQANWLNEQIKTAQTTIPGLERLVHTYRQAMDAGQADQLSSYTAWNNLEQSRIDLLALQEQLMETKIGLELATGLYRLDEVDQ